MGKAALEVLHEHGAPMTGREVKRAVEAKLGSKVHKDTMRHALQFGSAAKKGQIVRLSDGRYALGSSTSSPAVPSP